MQCPPWKGLAQLQKEKEVVQVRSLSGTLPLFLEN